MTFLPWDTIELTDARCYILECIRQSRTIDPTRVSRLTGFKHGAVQQFVSAVQDETRVKRYRIGSTARPEPETAASLLEVLYGGEEAQDLEIVTVETPAPERKRRLKKAAASTAAVKAARQTA